MNITALDETTYQRNEDTISGMNALMACMLYLGILIHAAVTYGVIDYSPAWTLKNTATHPFFDWLVSLIHGFRMPVFFVSSGYLAAIYFHTKGQKKYLIHLFFTLVIPFVFGLLVVLPLDKVSLAFSDAAFHQITLAPSSAITMLIHYDSLSEKIGHLWFLYFLLLCNALAFTAETLLRKQRKTRETIYHVCVSIFNHFSLRLFVPAALFFICLIWMGTPYLLTNNRWGINPAILSCYFLFFMTGWLIHKTSCLKRLMRYPISQLLAAFCLFLAAKLLPWPSSPLELIFHQALTAVSTTLFVFGFISFFLCCIQGFSERSRQLFDAANWAYIIHLPLVVFVPGLLSGCDWPIFLKFLVTLFSTAAICLVSYRVFVRNTLGDLFFNSGFRGIDVKKIRKEVG